MIFLLAAVAASDSPSLGAVGLGSNVVDRFYRVRGEDGLAPIVGVKGYFAAEGEVVGGVTLNHLSWAQALGVPTALAALQGEDEAGRMIRAAMGEHGISADALTVTEDVASSVSHVILDESGSSQCGFDYVAPTAEITEVSTVPEEGLSVYAGSNVTISGSGFAFAGGVPQYPRRDPGARLTHAELHPLTTCRAGAQPRRRLARYLRDD